MLISFMAVLMFIVLNPQSLRITHSLNVKGLGGFFLLLFTGKDGIVSQLKSGRRLIKAAWIVFCKKGRAVLVVD